jgi:hypothetical protein
VLAVVVLVMEKRLGVVLRRMALAASSGSLRTLPEQARIAEANSRPLPYGVALAVGALVVAWVPSLN